MITRRPSRSRICVWLLAFVFSAGALPVQADAEVVVNDGVKRQILPLNTVRAIFGMRLRTWPDGAPIRVFVLNDEHPSHVSFCKETLNIFPHQLRLAWDRLVFSGTGQAPYQVSSEEEMRLRIAATPGAIGYLEETMINESVHVPAIRR